MKMMKMKIPNWISPKKMSKRREVNRRKMNQVFIGVIMYPIFIV